MEVVIVVMHDAHQIFVHILSEAAKLNSLMEQIAGVYTVSILKVINVHVYKHNNFQIMIHT